jgi:hypothetical protein
MPQYYYMSAPLMPFVSINLPLFLVVESTSSNIFIGSGYHLQIVTEILKKSDYSTHGYLLQRSLLDGTEL